MTALRYSLIFGLIVVIAPIIGFLIYSSSHPMMIDGSYGPATIRYFAEIISGDRFFENLGNTVIYAVGSAGIALAVGATQAWLAERTDTPFRSLLYLAAIVSLGIPYVLYAVGWILLLGRSGPVNGILQAVTGSTEPLINVYSMGGLIFIEGFLWAPLAFLLLTAVFRNADASMEEASLMSGASVGTTVRQITLRLSIPAILALGMLVFIRAFESFEVPALVGMPGQVYVLTTEIYMNIYSTVPSNYGQASAFGIALVVMVVLLLWAYSRLSRHSYKYQTVTGKGFRPRTLPLGRWRWLASALLLLNILIVLVLPLAILVWAALLPYYQSFSADGLGLLTLDNLKLVFQSETFRGTMLNTIALGVACATAVTILAAFGGWMVARRKPWSGLLDQLASAPLAFPAIVLGLAFLNIFLNLPLPLYGTLLSIVIASVVALLPYGMRYGSVGVMQIHGELEEASRSTGAGQFVTFAKIVAPLVTPTLISCWLLVFLLAVRAVAMPLLLSGPDNQVVAVALFDLWQDGQISELAAMGVVWTTFMTTISIAFFAVSKRFGLLL